MAGGRLLLVEDDPALAELVEFRFRAEGYEVVRTDDGDEALLLAAEEAPDAIILDWMIEGTSGIEVCRRLKMRPETRGIPIIMLSARAEEVDRIRGLETGADDYVVKPFSPRELLARVKAVLRRTGHEKPKAAEGASQAFAVNEAKCQIIYYGEPLDLSRYEYNILTTFIRRPGIVFSRNQLMDLAWDDPDASMDRTIDAHIKNLRAKLKAVRPTLDPIVTHRGLGYSLKEGL